MEDSEVTGERWHWSIGEDQLKVTVFERPSKAGVLYLRWRVTTAAGRAWKMVSLGAVLRDAKGNIKRDIALFAKEQARTRYRTLGQPEPEPDTPAVLTIGATIAVVIDKDKGLYPRKSNHRSEVIRALKHAATIWGPSTPWSEIKRAEIRQLWRRRLADLQAKGCVGARGVETTVGRVLTVAAWLRDEGMIPDNACMPPRKWKQAVRDEAGNPDTKRPRYTLEEMRKILAVADQVDPRFGLMVAIGAELRLGQVLRVRRHDLDLPARTVKVRGAGKKRGTTVEFTSGQYASVVYALEKGYLRALEQQAIDYPLFPARKLRKAKDGVLEARLDRDHQPIGRRAVGDWWNEAERLAGIPHVPGRAAYGVRRVAVDGFIDLGISEEGLQNAGGWDNSQMPKEVYAERGRVKHRKEATAKRALLRGEIEPDA